MTKFTIFQAVKGNFFAEEINIADYKRIADIECESIDDAYALSQNIHSFWLENKQVTVFPHSEYQKAARSTSVGDLIFSHSEDTYYMVEDIVFSKVVIKNSKICKIP
jgi:hypothetical protein